MADVKITAAMVGALRDKTGAGLMDCKRALVETNGDEEAAIVILREKGLAVAAKKADRVAADGLVAVLTKGERVAMVEVNSETDFVAKNATFVEFVNGLLRTILEKSPADLEALKAEKFDGTEFTVEEKVKDMIFTIKEKIDVRRFIIVEGTTTTYVHGNGATGVIVKFDADATAKSNPGFAEFAKNIALQLGAFSTTPYLDRESVPTAVIAQEKEIISEQIKNDPKNASKPDAIIEKMAIGRLGKFYEENCLVDQAYIKDDSLTVGKYVEQTAKAFGGSIKVTGFVIYNKGEGIEKRVDNLDEEVAKMLNK
ncbi:MAG: translation elongation factor Ts [Clostridiales bacterium]|nr:translation elongation factor Ts [Clostridiales bacterium]